MEETWRTLLLPFLETHSFTHPLPTVNDPAFDYSVFDGQFAVKEDDEKWQKHFEWIQETRGSLPKGSARLAIDVKAIMKNLKFADSQDELGLQLADIVASAFHRACKGTLQKGGWKDLGSLFINKKNSVVDLIVLGPDAKSGQQVPVKNDEIFDVLATIRKRARSLFLS